MRYTFSNPIQQANMVIVDKLLERLPDWESFILHRHHKFIKAYINNKDLATAGEEFNFSKNDMLAIFWRIQKQLQLEHSSRVRDGKMNKQTAFVKTHLSIVRN